MPLTARIPPRERTRAASASGVLAAQLDAGRGAQRDARPAGRAGVGLRVEAPAARVRILRRAGRAHPERAHGRVRPVVGQALEDRVARPALGAVDERVAVAPVPRDRGARAGSRRRAPGRAEARWRRAPARPARRDRERGGRAPVRRAGRQRLHVLHARRGRRLGPERAQEGRYGRRGAHGADQHALGVVAHPAAQAEAGRHAVDEGPEADALHHAAHAQQHVGLGARLWRVEGSGRPW